MFKSINPATGETIATYEELSPVQLEAKLAKAASAYRHWRTTSYEERTGLLSRLAQAYDDNKERLARTASLEMGKTYASSLAEVSKCATAFRHYAAHGPAMHSA